LRVKYAFERLKDDSIFRKYTIKAIAQESGFKGAESFSKEFFKKYGVNPSYFIKELNILNN
jgi:AraC-like DNA-binding protein